MKKRSVWTKIAMLALAIAPGIVASNSFMWLGEEKIPQCMTKNKNDVV